MVFLVRATFIKGARKRYKESRWVGDTRARDSMHWATALISRLARLDLHDNAYVFSVQLSVEKVGSYPTVGFARYRTIVLEQCLG